MFARLPLPVTIAVLGILAAAVIAVTLSVGYRWSIGSFASVDASAADYAQELEGQLCQLGAAVTEYSATNDAQHFYTSLSETFLENRKTFTESRHYIESVKAETEANTTEGYAASRKVEMLWEATNATEGVIGSAYSWADRLRKSPGEAYFGGDWANAAMESELLVLLMGVNSGGKACARSSPSPALMADISRAREHVAESIRRRMKDYRNRAVMRAGRLAADPQTTPEARQAATEDLEFRDRILSADYDGLSRKAAMRLFGVIPD
ncbi:hypothetical protein [Dongia sp.]|uniref:hypothetical protein n=1 Tax=Dongia sp. TaxID=1977262 RepID=UPI003750E51D